MMDARTTVTAAAGLMLATLLVVLAVSSPHGTGGALAAEGQPVPVLSGAIEADAGGMQQQRDATRVEATPCRKLLHQDGDGRQSRAGGAAGPASSRDRTPVPQTPTAGNDHNVANPARIGFSCSTDDVAVYQSPTDKLPSGIPTYTVRVMNVCASGCAVSGVHVSCGWYSSAKLVSPRLFRRLRFDDCLVNDGQPIPVGDGLVFTYANTYRYPLVVTALSCDHNT